MLYSEITMDAGTAKTFQHGLVVDDHPAAGRWMEQALLEAFPGISVVWAASLEAGRQCVAQQLPQIALIDLGLPDGSGTELIAQLNQHDASIMSVVSTVFGDDAHLFDALGAGAQGYVLKDEAQPQLVRLLRGIANGEPPLSPSIARRLLQHFREAESPADTVPADSADDVKLTAREAEVLTLLAKGYTVKRVADLLNITQNTTAGYVKTIYRKLNIRNRAEATLEASRRGLVGEQTR